MKLIQIFPVLKYVLINPYVIGTTIVILLYCNFVSYVARYRKKPPKAKKRKTSSPPPAAQVQAENSENAEHPTEENAE
ncbi:MAG: hypothetical protein ACI4MA_00055 [Treponema sp.]